MIRLRVVFHDCCIYIDKLCDLLSLLLPWKSNGEYLMSIARSVAAGNIHDILEGDTMPLMQSLFSS